MTAIISWADVVTSVVEPPIMSVSSESGDVFGSVMVLPDSPSHTTDGLNTLSRNKLGGTRSRLVPMRARISAA